MKALLLFFAAVATAAEPKDLASTLEPIREKYKLPACGVAVIENGKITAIGVTGKRRFDRPTLATTADLWHIGSCTKSMTATLVAMLVDEGKLRWDMPVTEALPGIPAHSDWQKVTLDHLVTQRSGIPRTTGRQQLFFDGGSDSPRAQRAAFAGRILTSPPTQDLGKFAYSNSGYGLLGAIIERAADRSYEDLLRERIFEPLKLTTAGFGAPGKKGEWYPSQPWGHYRKEDILTPATPSPDNQFPPALSPAACVHMSLTDFVKYAWWLSSNDPALVKPDTLKKLQTPPPGSTYAGGLWRTELPGIAEPAVCHSGHMGGFFGVFYSTKKQACVAVFNTEGGGWEWLGDELAAASLKAVR